MKTAKKLFALATALLMTLPLVACRDNTGGGNANDGEYGDTVERPEIETPPPATQVVYPPKPATPPSPPAEGVKPSITAYTPSRSENPYAVSESEGKTHVTYGDVSNWAYVYASVENYSPQYGNIKITIENGAPAAERIAVQAVYYEAYDLGYGPVTVYLGEMSEGEQYVIAELGEHAVTDGAYQPVKGQSVKDKTVIGFVIFVDSLPSFAPAGDATGAFDILKFEFFEDGAPELEDRYVKPVADLSASEEKDGSLFVPVEKYSADYAKFTVKLNGAAETQADIAVRYTLGGTSAISAPKRVTLTGTEQTEEFDFTELRPTAGGDDFITQYVKNGAVDAVVITPAGGAEVAVTEIAFVRTATDGAYVTGIWSSSASAVRILRKNAGGNAKLEYSYYSDWGNFSVGVRNGDGVNKIRLSFYAPEGLDHLGIGVKNNSRLSSNDQPEGTFILRGSSKIFKGSQTESGTLGTLEPNLEGLTEKIEYDGTTKIYTLTYDFSKITKVNFGECTLSSLIFYSNCPKECPSKNEHAFKGTRPLYFLSIELFTAEESD